MLLTAVCGAVFCTLFQFTLTAQGANGGIKSVALSKVTYVYNGKVKTPAVVVTNAKGKTVKKSKQTYTVSYPKGRKAVGTYTVKIKFCGAYKSKGTVKKTFRVIPRATAVTSVSADKSSFTVKWKKLVAQTSGFQISYHSNNSAAKTITQKGTDKAAKKITSLKSGTTYFVKVRAFKDVTKGKKTKRYYSVWSAEKRVTTKADGQQEPAKDEPAQDEQDEHDEPLIPVEPKPEFEAVRTADYYYSSLEGAVADVNAQTFTGAETAFEGAAAGICMQEDGGAKIVLFRNADDVPALEINENAELYLNGFTLTFSEAAYLTFGKNLTVENGTVAVTNADSAISQSGSGTLCVTGVDINSKITSTSLTHRAVNITGNTDIKYTNINIDAAVCRSITGIYASNAAKSVSVKNTKITAAATNTQGTEIDAGINAYNSDSTLIERANITISVGNSSHTTYGMRLANAGSIVINGGTFFCENTNADLGNGIIVPEGAGDLTVNSGSGCQFTVFGKKRGMSSTARHTTVNGGEFYSYDMAGYFVLDSDITNAVFALKNSEKYTTVKGTDTLCFGGPAAGTKDAVMNLTGCSIAKPELLSDGSYSYSDQAVYIVSDYGYHSPKEINFTDCTFYQSNYHLFWFSQPTATNTCSTRVNVIGGKTAFYKKNLTQYTKNEIKGLVDVGGAENGWKALRNKSTDAVGNTFVGAGTPVAPSADNELYLTDSAGVYFDNSFIL